jgi:hypothetical protein
MSGGMYLEGKRRGRRAGASVFDTRRAHSTATRLVLMVVSLLAGCTAMLESEKPQCTTEADCISLFGAEDPFQCVRQVCERPACTQDSQCRDIGGRFATSICDTERNECVAAECNTVDGCGSNRACNLKTNRCEGRQCTITQDCLRIGTESPTMQCVGGFCVDEAWGCVGQPDDRTFQPGEKGTLRVPMYDPLRNAPLENAVWEALVCLPATEDPDCLHPLDVPSSYDTATGVLTVEQLDPELPVRLWLTETALPPPPPEAMRLNGKETVDMEFITQKPPVGITTTRPLRVVTWKWIASLIESYVQGAEISGKSESLLPVFTLGKQTIFGDAFDCQDRPAANLNVKFMKDGLEFTDYTPYFWDEQNLAFTPPTHIQTFGTGVWSTANLPVAQTLMLRSNLVLDARDGRSRVIRDEVPVYLNVSRMMTIHLYPRNYGLKSAR